jgi:putative membrane protein
VPLAGLVLAVAGYATAWWRLRRRGARWPPARLACLLAGSVCAMAAVSPPVASHDEIFPVHVAQHLLLAMAAPLLLAVSAPVTLALRTLPARPRRVLLRVLHSSPAAAMSRPVTILVLDIGGLYGFYLTGMYAAAERSTPLHAAVHLHMFLAGCLLSWLLIGADPIRRRPGTWGRLAVLVIAAASHDTLAKLMYAWNLPSGAGPVAARHLGSELMYYGGTVIEVALAVIIMAQWYAATGRALARERRTARRCAPDAPVTASRPVA